MAEPYYKQHWIDIEPERHAAYDQILNYHPALQPILDALELRPGLSVIDVGSGPGHTTMELARRVAPGGRVLGVDINANFVAGAQRRATELKLAATFKHAGFPPLPCESASFERVWCKNVLEYVDSAEATVVELARVAAPGGLVVAVDSDWEMIALEVGGPGQARSDKVLSAAKSIALKEPRIGRRLAGLFRAAGLRDIEVKIFAGADRVGRSLPMLRASLARYAVDSKLFSAAEVTAWLADIDRAIEHGDYLFVLPQFVVRGIKH